MHEFLYQYERVPPTTWVYLSSLMTIAVFFKFGRLWTIRNLDLLGLISYGPGLLCVYLAEQGRIDPTLAKVGYIWLFVVNFLFLIRLLIDPLMVRRPLLEPNLSVGGQTFVCCCLLAFLTANVITSDVEPADLARAPQAAATAEGETTPGNPAPTELAQNSAPNGAPADKGGLKSHGPGYRYLFELPRIVPQTLVSRPPRPAGEVGAASREANDQYLIGVATVRTIVILSHLAIVIGIVVIGQRHFDNIKTGIAAATLYLMMPYTALISGHVEHVLPAALLVWAIERYRRPLAAGVLMGLAIGVTYYPAFLLFLWISFYWQRGLIRFLAGAGTMIAILAGALFAFAPDLPTFVEQAKQMFGLAWPVMDEVGGIWKYFDPVYRIPMLAAFVALCISMAIWPAQKNLGSLMSGSAIVMLGAQFWHAHGGGLYMAWFLPLLLLTVFRPNLEDRVALSVLGEGWLSARKNRPVHVERAA